MLGPTANRIKADLPNFPDEVVQTWLLRAAQHSGWPPAPFSRWDKILLHRSLSFWRTVTWERRRVPVNAFTLDRESLGNIRGLLEANVAGARNVYAQQISDTKQRFNRILQYLQQHGRLPIPPVLLSNGYQYTVLDGNHRLAAYLCFGASLLGPTCWICRPPPPNQGPRAYRRR